MERDVRAGIVRAPKGMRVANIDGEKRHLAGAGTTSHVHEQGELPVVCALQSHPNADGSTFVRGQPNSLADLVKGIEAPDGGIGRGVRSVQRYRDRIEELGDTTRVLCQGQSRGQEPDVLAVVLQRSSY